MKREKRGGALGPMREEREEEEVRKRSRGVVREKEREKRGSGREGREHKTGFRG